MKKTMLKIAVAAAIAVPFAAQAAIFTFNASLSGANENPDVASPGSGIAILAYDNKGTSSLLDDTFSVAVSAFNLSAPATGYHIHGAAATFENAPIAVNFENAPFVATPFGNNIIIGGMSSVANVVPRVVNGNLLATPSTAINQGYPEMPFLEALQSHLTYVNIHTSTNPGGEIRGQLIQVQAIPEPEAYALMLAGLGLVGWVASRRRKVGV